MRQLTKRPEPPPTFFEALLRRVREITWGGESENEGLREQLEGLIEEAEAEAGTSFSEEERRLVRNALAFGELKVEDVGVPRADIEGVEVTAGLSAVVARLREIGHSQLVVYRGTLDDVLGIVHVKDLLAYWGGESGAEFSLEKVVRPVLVVPPSMRVIDLLLEMRSSPSRVAIVVDEFGGTDGLVTVEDMVEEIVGELQGGRVEAQGPAEITDGPDGTIEASGRADLDELEERLGVPLLGEDERDEADTLAGLIFNLVDRVPSRGEVVRHPAAGLELEVLDADPRRIKRVRIRRVPPAPEGGGGGEGEAGDGADEGRRG